MQPHVILDRINQLPRIQLARKNTPFEEMPRLRAAIADSMDADIDAVPPLFIKRDDTTGFAFGGNKARHMEFMFAHLIERGIDTVININHYDSNNARFVAASCAKTGMKYHWVAYDMIDAPVMGNMLIAHLAGAEIHRVPDSQTARLVAERLLTEEIADGRNATIVSDNPFFDIAGMIAFLETGSEVDIQIANFPSPLMGEDQGERGQTSNPFNRGSDTPIHIWGLCGRSIAGIRLYTLAIPANLGSLPPLHNSSHFLTPTKASTSIGPPVSPTFSAWTPRSNQATLLRSPATQALTALPPTVQSLQSTSSQAPRASCWTPTTPANRWPDLSTKSNPATSIPKLR